MIGDLLLWFRKVWTQLWCRHDYKFYYGRAYPFAEYDHYECLKCGKWKWR